MKPAERALIELQSWVDARGEGLSINYASHNPTIIDGVPHKWSVQVGRTDREHYTGYGVSHDAAVLDAFSKWQAVANIACTGQAASGSQSEDNSTAACR